MDAVSLARAITLCASVEDIQDDIRRVLRALDHVDEAKTVCDIACTLLTQERENMGREMVIEDINRLINLTICFQIAFGVYDPEADLHNADLRNAHLYA